MEGNGLPDVDAATAAIGARLTEIRLTRRMKVTELARSAGVSSSLISQIERGSSKPSVGTLFALAQVLDVPVDGFFSDTSMPAPGPPGAPPRSPSPREDRVDGVLDKILDGQSGDYRLWRDDCGSEREVVRRDERASLDIRGGVRWERLTPTPLDAIEFLELIYGPGAESDGQVYRHPGIELVLVTSGTMTIHLGFAQHDLSPGDSIAFASSIPHRYVNLTETEARAVTVILRDDLSKLPIREQRVSRNSEEGSDEARSPESLG